MTLSGDIPSLSRAPIAATFRVHGTSGKTRGPLVLVIVATAR